MNESVFTQLLAINRQFYQTFGLQFSEKRQRLQPGVIRLMSSIPQQASILDIGCGNGEFACELARRPHQGGYVGLDFSLELLSEADSALENCLPPELARRFKLQQADLASPTWDAAFKTSQFDLVTAFAVLHHIPGFGLRQEILKKVHHLLKPAGRCMLSVWQFLNSPRLAERVQPWEKIGLSAQDVDSGDYLLDWRHGGIGLRYIHHFTPGSLAALAQATGFHIDEAFHSDGRGGRLGLYQVWSPSTEI